MPGVPIVSGIQTGSIRIDHAGTVTHVTPLSFQPLPFPDCGTTEANHVAVVIPKVAKSDSLILYFDSYTCDGVCMQDLPSYQVQYYYKKPCPVNGFVSDTFNISADPDFYLNSNLIANFGVCMEVGQKYPLLYKIISKRLIQPYGFLRLDFTMKHGLYWPTDCPKKLGTTDPIKIDSIANPDKSYTLQLTYKLPLPADSLDLPFCLQFYCDSNVVCEADTINSNNGGVIHASNCGTNPCELSMTYKTNWLYQANTSAPCAITSCGGLKLAVDIPPGCVPQGDTLHGGEPGPGTTFGADSIVYSWKFRTYRTNFGLQDLDDDRKADAFLPAHGTGVRIDRFLPGDTMRVEYCASVDSGKGLRRIPRDIFEEILQSEMGLNGTDAFETKMARTVFTNSNNFKLLKDSIRVKYADGTQVTCPLNDEIGEVDKKYYEVQLVNTYPIQFLDELVTMNHKFYVILDTLFKHGCLPKPTLDQGDSIFFYTDFKLDFNFISASNNLPDPPLVGFRTALDHELTRRYAWSNVPTFKRSEYSGYKITFNKDAYSIKPCENSIEVKPFRYRLRIARPNMFPYEVRPLGRLFYYYQSKPKDVFAVSTKINYLVMQDSVPVLNNFPLSFVNDTGGFKVNFAPAFSNPIDEGFMMGANFVFGPSCTFAKPDSSTQFWNVAFPMSFSHPQTVQYSLFNKLGFFSNHPELKMESPDSIFYIEKRNFELHLTIKNPVVSSAPGVWLSAISPSGQSYDFDLLTLPQNQTLSSQNGIFNLGNLQGLAKQDFLLRGKDNYCKDDTLLLIFGWGCGLMSDLNQSTCFRDTLRIRLVQVEPELELAILQQPPSIVLCDTSDYYEFEIFNAKKGYAYDLLATAGLPPGLQIVPGTCQLAYPGNANFVNIPDPSLLANNIYQWNINSLLPAIAIAGLPGNDLQPQNTIRIRFKVIAQCGFVANTQPIFGIRGTEPCGKITNVLNKPGNPIQVQGLNPTYGVVINIQPVNSQPINCGGNQQFTVKITLLGSPAAGDSVFIIMPLGASLVAGSYLPGVNAPTGAPQLTPKGFRIPLPVGISSGSNVEFKFTAGFTAGSGCDNLFMVAQTRVKSEAFCQTLGAPCTVYVATGESATALTILHPELKITAASATVSGNQTTMNITLQNTGALAAPGQTVQIWQDVDGSGTITPGDIQLSTINGLQNLAPGASVSISGTLGSNTANLCNLLVVVPAADNCTCTDQVVRIHNFSIQYTPQTICFPQQVPIGVPAQSGFTYQWTPPAGIACPTCASTTYVPGTWQPGVPVLLTLQESNSGCTIVHHFSLQLSPLVTVSTSNAVVCAGKPVTLTVNPAGATYHWQGPGVVNAGAQTQTVVPPANATYQVTVTLPNQCVVDTSIAIQVLPSDTLTLPGLITCKGHPVLIGGQVTDISGTYTTKLVKSNGCDSLILQSLTALPNPNTAETKIFCKGDTLHVLDTVFTGSGQICRQYKAANGCDSIHCIQVTAVNPPVLPVQDTIKGTVHTPITISGPNGFVSYVWVPIDTLCPNCPSIVTNFDTAGLYKYIVTVKDQNGCDALATYYIIILPICDLKHVQIPNAFTPNGDGLNDNFQAVVTNGGPPVTGTIEIYDRWGAKIFENKGVVSWDGKVKGVEAPSDTYIYLIHIDCSEDDQNKKFYGSVSLLR
jgi:gliding motility-associated-like protein